MTIGERIKSIRESKNIGQTELANATGISKQSIYKYENNIITNIPSDKIEAISSYLCVSPATLMGWDNEAGSSSHDTIRLDADELEFLREIRERPEMKIMFSVTKNATKEDLMKAVKIVEALKAAEEGGTDAM